MPELTTAHWSILGGATLLIATYFVWRLLKPKFERLCGACRRSTDFRNSHCPNCTQPHATVGFLYRPDDRRPHFNFPDE